MSFYNEFKKFISKGNMIDLAVGVVIGTAFGNVISSLVADIFMPPLGLLISDTNSLKAITIPLTSTVHINIGNFLHVLLTFLIIAFAIFVFLKLLNKFVKKEEKKEAAPEDTKDQKLLTEIRDLLKNR
jgi:large conductance mechanosensitive channel